MLEATGWVPFVTLTTGESNSAKRDSKGVPNRHAHVRVNRSGLKTERSKVVEPMVARSAATSPMALANLKPCPEQALTDDHARVGGQGSEYEVIVRCVGVEADGRGAKGTRCGLG